MSSNFKITANFRREEFSRFVYMRTQIRAYFLTKSKEELQSKLKRDKRRGVTKAKEKGVEIEEITEKGLMPIFYDLVKETYTNRGNLLEDISLFDAVFAIV